MANFIRIKRRLEDDAVEALKLHFKKPRVENPASTSNVTTILKFAATASSHDESLNHINELAKKIIHKDGQQASSVKDRLRKEAREAALRNRYNVISSFRHSADQGSLAVVQGSVTQAGVIDVVVDRGSEPNEDPVENNYVYDVYYTGEQFDVNMDNLLSVEPYEELVYTTNDSDDEEANVVWQDDSDSNDEDNWRNEYPDSEVDDEDMLSSMQRVRVGSESYELSSDGGEEDFVYSREIQDDIDRYGPKYARYKHKLTDHDYCKASNEEHSSEDD